MQLVKKSKKILETGVHKEEEEDCKTISEIKRSGDFTFL
jgi:riboflavin synthase